MTTDKYFSQTTSEREKIYGFNFLKYSFPIFMGIWTKQGAIRNMDEFFKTAGM